MQKLYFVAALFALCKSAFAQLPEDALRNSWTSPFGTARQQAIGGAMGSLGGEITSGFVNPAGLGLYRTNEVVLSPGWSFIKSSSDYLGKSGNGPSVNHFILGPSGAVFAINGGDPQSSGAFAIAVNRMADFNNHVVYGATNNYSSFAEQYAEEFAGSGLSIDGGIASNSLSYGTRMALYTYLIDTATINGVSQVIAQPQKAGSVLQNNDLLSKGGITEIGLSLASGRKDKWYYGGTLGIPILSYTRYQTYTESDATGNPNNDFESFIYKETYHSSGWGLNLKLGAIFHPNNSWRVGVAVHTPSFLMLTDKINASMISRTENYTTAKEISISSDSLDALVGAGSNSSVQYYLYTPWKILVSGSYVFGGGEADVKSQKGFITADLEYITTRSPRFHVPDQQDAYGNTVSGDNSYYDQVNQAIKSAYKGTLGAHLGGEMKFDTWMVRAGAAYYTSPYNFGLQADRLFLSTGLGYRGHSFFVDLALTLGFTRDVDFPYRLADKDNYYATLRETSATALVTVGYKF
jgi:hypothetical protein